MDKKKILIIDDEEEYGQVLKKSLESVGGYEVEIETKGARGVSSVKNFMPDLILLDVMMPDVDGGDVASQLKVDAAVKDIPIILVTGAVTKEEIGSQSVIAGYPVITKPVSIQELLECIKENLNT